MVGQRIAGMVRMPCPVSMQVFLSKASEPLAGVASGAWIADAPPPAQPRSARGTSSTTAQTWSSSWWCRCVCVCVCVYMCVCVYLGADVCYREMSKDVGTEQACLP